MTIHRTGSALVLAFSLFACSLEQVQTSEVSEEISSNASKLVVGSRPGPDTGGGIAPKFEPPIDPLHDPLEPQVPVWAGGIQTGGPPTPWQLQDPAGEAGCKCKMLCTERDGKRDCIENCVGKGC